MIYSQCIRSVDNSTAQLYRLNSGSLIKLAGWEEQKSVLSGFANRVSSVLEGSAVCAVLCHVCMPAPVTGSSVLVHVIWQPFPSKSCMISHDLCIARRDV